MTIVDAVLKVATRVVWRKSRHRKFLESITNWVMASIKPKQQAEKSATAEHEGIDPAQYYENRLRSLAAQKEAGHNVYPHKFELTLTVPEYIKRYGSLNSGEYLKDAEERITGRLMISSSKLFFYELHGGGAKVQVMADARKSGLDEEEFSKYHSSVKLGDNVGIIGFPGKIRGELSIFPKTFIVLSHCLHNMPRSKIGSGYDIAKVIDPWVPGRVRNLEAYTLKDEETRYRWRFLDLILNMEVREIIWTRRNLTFYIRGFLDNRGFMEVETPIMNMIAGGGATRPFVTHHNDLNTELYLRGSSELYLKQLVVGGVDRVYEIGKQFSNEGIDLTHHPEFTTCEFYMAYEDYYDLMKLTEEMLSGMVKELTGGYIIKYHANGLENDPIEIDFTPPFRRIDLIDELEKLENISIPEDLSTEEANKYLLDLCSKFDIKCSPPLTTARLLDKLVGHFLKETCMNPTFIINHPEIMSPLAKRHRSKPGLTERFELFINKFEVSNGYTVLNDPVVQRQHFTDQHKNRHSGNDEAMTLIETFLVALEYGLPPTGGCEFRIDRLAMLLTDSQNIKEVILFPAMKPLDEPSDKESNTKTLFEPPLSQVLENIVKLS